MLDVVTGRDPVLGPVETSVQEALAASAQARESGPQASRELLGDGGLDVGGGGALGRPPSSGVSAPCRTSWVSRANSHGTTASG